MGHLWASVSQRGKSRQEAQARFPVAHCWARGHTDVNKGALSHSHTSPCLHVAMQLAGGKEGGWWVSQTLEGPNPLPHVSKMDAANFFSPQRNKKLYSCSGLSLCSLSLMRWNSIQVEVQRPRKSQLVISTELGTCSAGVGQI